jgi:Four helix bundle sensory module for signal transduction
MTCRTARAVRLISPAGASGRVRNSTQRITNIIALVLLFAGCDVNKALERLSEARRLSADLLVQFTTAAHATDRAVMADTDEVSLTFAHEAEQATATIQTDAEALAPILRELSFEKELDLLQQFDRQFADYRTLDRSILDLAVENTNLKAQRLSFDAAQEAADTMRDSLEAIASADAAREAWHVKALAASALASARDIQALQAPHIAEADDAAMSTLEKRMASSEKKAREALQALSGLIQPASRPKLAAATAALNRLMEVNAQIIGLSRRNSNVRSLALSLNQKRTITAACEESLRSLHDALAKRGFTGIR